MKILNYLVLSLSLVSCMSQPPAPVEFKSGAIKNDTSKYSILEEDSQITTNTIDNIPEQEAPTNYLADEQDIVPKAEENFEEQPNLSSEAAAMTNQPEASKDQDLDAALGALLPEAAAATGSAANANIANTNIASKSAQSQDDLDKKDAPLAEVNKEEYQEQNSSANAVNKEFVNPVAGKLISPFNKTTQGINIAATLGDPVKAIHGGKVVFAEHSNQYGNLVMVKAENSDLFVAYGHLDELKVSKGELIEQNHLIGYVGQTGKVDFPQLYLAIRKGKIALDPLEYLDY